MHKRKILYILLTLIATMALLPNRIYACSCSDSSRYYEMLKRDSIIWRISVNDLNYSIDELEYKYGGKDIRLRAKVDYDLVENISNSNVPEIYPLYHDKYIEVVPAECSCRSYSRGEPNTLENLQLNNDYVVFGKFDEYEGNVYIAEIIGVSGDRIYGDFGPYGKWDSYEELIADLGRIDNEIYERKLREKDRQQMYYVQTYVEYISVASIILVPLLFSLYMLHKKHKWKLFMAILLITTIYIAFNLFLFYSVVEYNQARLEHLY